MDPSIMKLLEEDEDETMHSGADVEAFTAALNRHIEGGDTSTSQPADSGGVLSQGNSHTSNQFVDWQITSHGENTMPQSLQDSKDTLQKSYNSSEMELKRQGQDTDNQQQIDLSQEMNSLPLQHLSSKDGQPSQPEQPMHRPIDMQSSDKNPVPTQEHNRTQNPEPQHLNLHGISTQQSMSTAMTGQQSMSVGTSSQQPVTTGMINQTEMASATGSQSTGNALKQGKQVPFAMLFPHIQPQLDKDRAMQLQTLYHKLRKNEITKEGFVKHMRSLIGDQMLKMAVYKFQSQAARNSQAGPNQFPPQSQASTPQHLQAPSNDSSNLAIDSSAQKLHEVEHQADLHGVPGNQVSSSSLSAIKQEREHPPFPPLQGLNNHQQKHLHFSQASIPPYANMGNNYHPYSATNTSSMPTPLKPQPQDPHMRPISAHQSIGANQLGSGTQTMNMINTPKFDQRQNSYAEPRRSITHMTSSSIAQQGSVHWQSSSNKERRSILPPPMMNVKAEPTDQLHDQQHKSQLSSPSFTPVQNEPGASTLGTSNDESFDMPSTSMGFLTAGHRVAQNLPSNPMPTQVDTSNSLNSSTLTVTSPSGVGNNVKTPSKKPSVGQKKPLDTLGSSPPPSGKKQKVSGALADQSIEQLNDVTAVSGVNLREEEEQLFSGPKEESRVSEASRRVVQEEEEKLILQKIPLQKKLTEIMGKCGLKNMSNDVERCLSLCVEERMRALISTLIRLSKQRADFEKTRHRTIVTSDVRQQIMAMNRKAREEWERKQAEADKVQKTNEPDGNAAADGDKDKDDGQAKSVKVNKEEDDKMRTTAANVAARAAVGGDDMLSKWQLMAEQAKQKRDAASGSHPGKDMAQKPSSSSSRNTRDNQEAEKRSSSAASITPGDDRNVGRNQLVPQTRVGCSITIKDVIAVLEREPQTSKSTLIYRLYERICSDGLAE
nr:transcription initiation factor TFIID subunit 4B-like isoform X1 [Ipomoea batatas]GMD89166.1 transcription initiation factor TFIID subunit 4B-like isoform X1 [Ipomoea batatas]